jgi:hypothetical protein|tara:strand:+ start:1479 stop:1625 length:147 start_codon:yes stop_codon:yes gene_type:complete
MGKTKELFEQLREGENHFLHGSYEFWNYSVNPITGWREERRVRKTKIK